MALPRNAALLNVDVSSSVSSQFLTIASPPFLVSFPGGAVSAKAPTTPEAVPAMTQAPKNSAQLDGGFPLTAAVREHHPAQQANPIQPRPRH